MNHYEITSMAREAGLFVPRAGLPENGALIRFFHAAYAAGMGMTTLRAAAQQALEALEGGADSWQRVGPAIDALKAALAEPKAPASGDPHRDHWVAIAETSQRIAASKECGPAEAASFCAAIERLSAALKKSDERAAAAEPVQEHDLSRCPKCGGPADNGHDREVPPNPYYCTKCMAEPVAWRWGYRSVTTGEMDWRGYVEIAAHPNLRSPAIIMEPLYTAPPQQPAEPQEPVAWLRVIDEAMVTHHLGTANQNDDYETAKRKMNNLLCCAQDIGTYFAKQAEPVQEPVAWMYDCGNGGRMYAEELDGVPGWMPLYTAPPQRPAEPVAYSVGRTLHWHEGKGVSDAQLFAVPPQRKPLTEEEKRALADKFLSCQPESYEVSGVFDLISAVERAHGIGGEHEQR